MVKNQRGFHHIFLLLVVIVVGIVSFAGYRVIQKNQSNQSPSSIISSNKSAEDKAVLAGKNLSSDKCSGTGDATFTNLPMKSTDFGFLIPYGDVVGGHVTPIDHQYFTPAVYNSPRDSYPVYAMADATITNIQPRTNDRGTEYRFVFAYSCTFLYYYDLVTSLSGDIKTAYEKNGQNLTLKVKAGQQVGSIGGQTLDFAVWRTNDSLKGFINPASYDAEGWKIYTTDPLPYYTAELKATIVAKNPRTAQPISGKIDYDIDGKLIGNWFLQGSGGYHDRNNTAQDYWTGHLSIAPNVYDPSVFVISLGSFGGQAKQFVSDTNQPDPATVGVSSGLVKYNLATYEYKKQDGSRWDKMNYTLSPVPYAAGSIQGCILAQLTDTRILKAESFPGKSCSGISTFDTSAKLYTR